MIIGVDLDDTIADLETPWLARYNALGHPPLRPEDLTSWGSIAQTPIGDKIYTLLTPDLFANLEPLPGAIAALEEASFGNRIVVTTACLSPEFGPAKVEWVKKHLPFVNHKDIFLGGSKELLNFDVFIDDSPHNVKAYRHAHPNAKIFIPARPYNACVA